MGARRVLAGCLVLVAVLSSCTTTRVIYRDVEIPVPVPCRTPPPAVRPQLPSPGVTDAETIRALTAAFLLLQGYAVELEALLDGYRKKVEP